MKNKKGVYAIVNILTSKMYIGSSQNITRRLSEHKRALKKGKHYNQELQNDWNKSEGFNFKAKVLETIEGNDLFERERYHIEKSKNIYNIHLPDNNGRITFQPDLVKEKIREICAQDVINNPDKYIQARNKTAVTIRKMIAENDPTVGIGKKRSIVLYNETCSHTFVSVKEAAAFINVTATRITECLVGFKHKEKGVKRKVNSIKGYKCKYLEI